MSDHSMVKNPAVDRAAGEVVGEVPLAGLLQDMVLESIDVEEFLTNLSKLAAERLSSRGTEVLGAVTLLRPRSKTTVASSSDPAKRMDEVQYAFNDGPCLRAARENKTYTVTDFSTETRFGEYSHAFSDHGLLSALGIPIPLNPGAPGRPEPLRTHGELLHSAGHLRSRNPGTGSVEVAPHRRADCETHRHH